MDASIVAALEAGRSVIVPSPQRAAALRWNWARLQQARGREVWSTPDITTWEDRNGRIPEGSVVFVRSDWSKAWPDPKLATLKQFPGVGLDVTGPLQ